ncbi:MAG: F0F1 ATP synthase subunit alpha [Rickettsiales bacterium]
MSIDDKILAKNSKKTEQQKTISKSNKNNNNQILDKDNKILNFSYYEEGIVTSSVDGIVLVFGLQNAFIGEKIEIIANKDRTNVIAIGIVMNLDEASVSIVLINGKAEEGDYAIKTNKKFTVKIGKGILGRVLNGQGDPIDGLGEIKGELIDTNIEQNAAGIIDRQSVCEPLYTGIKIIDALIPIGKGQRELIIGDRQTGKSTIAIDTVLNQKNNKNKPVYCIYVFIGQRQDEVKRLHAKLIESGSMAYTTIISASSSESAMSQFLAPYVGTAIGEYFMYNGDDALIIYDDLSKHAASYREISLLLKRPPGREAYPGDVFYIHSKLLERAAKLSDKMGGGSLTALPIIETKGGDVSGYISTNVISITDGQIILDMDLFNKGIKPAINIGLSVSRVGSSAQTKTMAQIAGSVKVSLAQYYEIAQFAQFGSDLDEQTQNLLNNGRKIVYSICQKQNSPIKAEYQILILFLAIQKYLDKYTENEIDKIQSKLFQYFEYCETYPNFYEKILSGKKLDKDQLESMHIFMKNFLLDIQ